MCELKMLWKRPGTEKKKKIKYSEPPAKTV